MHAFRVFLLHLSLLLLVVPSDVPLTAGSGLGQRSVIVRDRIWGIQRVKVVRRRHFLATVEEKPARPLDVAERAVATCLVRLPNDAVGTHAVLVVATRHHQGPSLAVPGEWVVADAADRHGHAVCKRPTSGWFCTRSIEARHVWNCSIHLLPLAHALLLLAAAGCCCGCCCGLAAEPRPYIEVQIGWNPSPSSNFFIQKKNQRRPHHDNIRRTMENQASMSMVR